MYNLLHDLFRCKYERNQLVCNVMERTARLAETGGLVVFEPTGTRGKLVVLGITTSFRLYATLVHATLLGSKEATQ